MTIKVRSCYFDKKSFDIDFEALGDTFKLRFSHWDRDIRSGPHRSIDTDSDGWAWTYDVYGKYTFECGLEREGYPDIVIERNYDDEVTIKAGEEEMRFNGEIPDTKGKSEAVMHADKDGRLAVSFPFNHPPSMGPSSTGVFHECCRLLHSLHTSKQVDAVMLNLAVAFSESTDKQ